MKKLITFLTIALCAVSYNAVSQISFTYDADGNMETRRVVTLKSATVDANEEEAANVEEESPLDIVSAELGTQTITVYPNPTRGRILVEIQPLNHDETNFMRLFNSQGQLMVTVNITSEQMPLEIVGSAGVYLLDVHLGNSVSKWKIIKQ